MGQGETKPENNNPQGASEEDLREAFNLFDKDNSGTITLEEFHTVLKAFGKTVSEEEVKEMIQKIDANNDGTIDFEEFKAAITNSANVNDSEADLKDAFRIITNGTRLPVTPEELKKNIPTLTDSEVKALFKTFDHDHEGKINYDKFVNIWNAKA